MNRLLNCLQTFSNQLSQSFLIWQFTFMTHTTVLIRFERQSWQRESRYSDIVEGYSNVTEDQRPYQRAAKLGADCAQSQRTYLVTSVRASLHHSVSLYCSVFRPFSRSLQGKYTVCSSNRSIWSTLFVLRSSYHEYNSQKYISQAKTRKCTFFLKESLGVILLCFFFFTAFLWNILIKRVSVNVFRFFSIHLIRLSILINFCCMFCFDDMHYLFCFLQSLVLVQVHSCHDRGVCDGFHPSPFFILLTEGTHTYT